MGPNPANRKFMFSARKGESINNKFLGATIREKVAVLDK
jgi:hypothetical protein